MNRKHLALGVVALIAAWLLRYDVELAGSGAGAYLLDRWTGSVHLLAQDRQYEVKKAKSE